MNGCKYFVSGDTDNCYLSSVSGKGFACFESVLEVEGLEVVVKNGVVNSSGGSHVVVHYCFVF